MTNIAKEILFEPSAEILDALTFLNRTHGQRMALFASYSASVDAAEKRQLGEEICLSAGITLQLEEELVYPVLKQVMEEQRLGSLIAMHHSRLRYLLAELHTLEPGSAIFDIKLNVLCEQLKDFHREKQRKLYASVKNAQDIDLWRLGAQLAQPMDELSLCA